MLELVCVEFELFAWAAEEVFLAPVVLGELGELRLLPAPLASPLLAAWPFAWPNPA